MPHDQLIRNIPDDLRFWIEAEARERRKSKQELTLEMLLRARDVHESERMPLFQALPPPEEPEPPETIPFKFIDLFAGIGGFRQATIEELRAAIDTARTSRTDANLGQR